jgi:hypothetical protein
MTNALKGIIHGKVIELDQEPGLPDGQAVIVTVEPIPTSEQTLPPGEGLRRSAGAWADDPRGLEEYLDWNRQQRKILRRPHVGHRCLTKLGTTPGHDLQHQGKQRNASILSTRKLDASPLVSP